MDLLIEPGDRLGRFLIKSVLGKGGTGVVYLAQDTTLNVTVALKVLLPGLANREMIERFKREVLLTRRIVHPGVCRLYDIHEQEELVFISMEYVEGETLQSIIQRRSSLSVGSLGKMALQICHALGSAHLTGVIHRDLKTANIMVKRDGQVSILDFGFAKSLDSSTITSVGFAVGTLGYMAPEVLEGKPATVQSDLYSLGVILYRCLTGRLPFSNTGIQDLLKAIGKKNLAPPCCFNPTIPKLWDKIVMRLLAPDPKGRYTSTEDLASDLTRISGEGELHKEADSSVPWQGWQADEEPTQKTDKMSLEISNRVLESPESRLVGGSMGDTPKRPKPLPTMAKKKSMIWQWGILSFVVATGCFSLMFLFHSQQEKEKQSSDKTPVVGRPDNPLHPAAVQQVAEPIPAVEPAASEDIVPPPAKEQATSNDDQTIIKPVDKTRHPKRGDIQEARLITDKINQCLDNKGLIRKDSMQLDEEITYFNRLKRKKQYSEAILVGKQTMELCEKFQVDETFLRKKVTRFNQWYDINRDRIKEAESAKVDIMLGEYLGALERQEYIKANEVLNQLHQLISSHRLGP